VDINNGGGEIADIYQEQDIVFINEMGEIIADREEDINIIDEIPNYRPEPEAVST